MTRPGALVFVTGTGTEVGKTWWTAHVASELRAAGVAVAARKPVQSGDGSAPEDSAVLAAATGEEDDRVTPPHRTWTRRVVRYICAGSKRDGGTFATFPVACRPPSPDVSYLK